MKPEVKKTILLGVGVLLLYIIIHYLDQIASFLGMLLSAAAPLLLGGVMAYLVNILMSGYERRWFPRSSKKIIVKTRRAVCLILAVLTMLLLAALIVLLVIPQIWSAIQLLWSEVPPYMKKLLAWIEERELLPENIFTMLEQIDWKSQLSKIIAALTTGFSNVVDVAVNLLSKVFTSVVNTLLAIIFALYLLLEKEKLMTQAKKILTRYGKTSFNQALYHVLAVADDCFRKFIVGQCVEAMILGVLCTLGMLILRFPYATMIGALVAFTALIPVAGAYIGAGVGAFMILTESPFQALLFLVYIVVLQQVEGNLIYPRVVGSSIGLPGIWVLAAVTVGGGVMGIGGMLLGVPLCAVFYRLLREDVQKGLSEQ